MGLDFVVSLITYTISVSWHQIYMYVWKRGGKAKNKKVQKINMSAMDGLEPVAQLEKHEGSKCLLRWTSSLLLPIVNSITEHCGCPLFFFWLVTKRFDFKFYSHVTFRFGSRWRWHLFLWQTSANGIRRWVLETVGSICCCRVEGMTYLSVFFFPLLLVYL